MGLRPSGQDSTHPIAVCMVGSPEAKSREVAISDMLRMLQAYGLPFRNPVREGLPTMRELTRKAPWKTDRFSFAWSACVVF